MPTTIRRLAVATSGFTAIVAVFLVLPVVWAEPAETRAGPRDGILLLRNGNLLRGKVTQTDERHTVLVDAGEIHVATHDVEFFCRTLEEGYRLKKTLVRPGNARDLLNLAQWCQRYGLLGAAVDELAEAKAVDPRHPLIPLVERRIGMALWQPKPTEPPPPTADRSPTVGELDRLVRGMPPGSVETFTRTIQPTLVNGCSMAGCHGPQTETEFRLLRTPSGRPANRRVTQRNLHSTLEWIDHADPAASPILTAPIRPHGSAKAAVFTDRQMGQYQQLVDWVHQVAGEPMPVTTASHEARQPGSAKDAPSRAVVPAVHTVPADSTGADPSEGVRHAAAPEVSAPEREPDSTPPGPDGVDPASAEVEEAAADPGSSIQRGATRPQFIPVDPFDPEIFNRRFHR